MFWIGLIVGLLAGAIAGWFVCALFTVAVHQEQLERICRFRHIIWQFVHCSDDRLADLRIVAGDLLDMED